MDTVGVISRVWIVRLDRVPGSLRPVLGSVTSSTRLPSLPMPRRPPIAFAHSFRAVGTGLGLNSRRESPRRSLRHRETSARTPWRCSLKPLIADGSTRTAVACARAAKWRVRRAVDRLGDRPDKHGRLHFFCCHEQNRKRFAHRVDRHPTMPPTHWEEALDASAVSRPGTTQYEPGPRWEAWEDELRETHEYDDWESKLQASAKRDPSMRPRKVTTVDVMVREALVSGLDQDEAIARAAAAPPPPSPFHPPYKGLGMVPRDRAPKREEDWWDHDDLHPDAHRMHGGANAETATYADGSPRKPHGGRKTDVDPATGSWRSPRGKTLNWKPHELRDGEGEWFHLRELDQGVVRDTTDGKSWLQPVNRGDQPPSRAGKRYDAEWEGDGWYESSPPREPSGVTESSSSGESSGTDVTP